MNKTNSIKSYYKKKPHNHLFIFKKHKGKQKRLIMKQLNCLMSMARGKMPFAICFNEYSNVIDNISLRKVFYTVAFKAQKCDSFGTSQRRLWHIFCQKEKN